MSVASNEKVRNPVGEGIEMRVLDLAGRRTGGAPVPKDRLIGDLAARQFGVVARRQLLAMGIGAGAIDTRLKRHYLHRLHRGVYAVGHLALLPLAREMAAVLACGPGAAVSHRSAAAVWHLLKASEHAPIEISATSGKRRPGIQTHTTTRLTQQDVRHLRGLPLTSPARTLVDLADTATARELERATAEALARRLVTARSLLADGERFNGRRGIARIKSLIENAVPPALTRSEAEERFLALVRAAGLRQPEVNVMVQGYEVDFLWRDEGVIVEIDGFRYHSSRSAFESDRHRDADLQGGGLSVLRVTWRQLIEEPYATLASTVRMLGRR